MSELETKLNGLREYLETFIDSTPELEATAVTFVWQSNDPNEGFKATKEHPNSLVVNKEQETFADIILCFLKCSKAMVWSGMSLMQRAFTTALNEQDAALRELQEGVDSSKN